MASIATSIEVYDRATQPLTAVVNALHATVGAMSAVNTAMGSGMNTSSIERATQEIENAVNEVNNLQSAIHEANASQISPTSTNQINNALEQTEQQIINNTHQQDNFNQEMQQGVNHSNELMRTIKNIVVAYMSIQTVKKAMDLSDELTQTTARLGMMNDAFNKVNGTAMQTNDLVQMVYQSAQNARGSFSDMAAVVAKFGNNARDAFSSQREVVDFANLIQKQMTIAGASSAEASNAMLQLSQALGSGVLRGDELNSIFEQAPNLIQSIADYLDVPIGQIRAMAQEGQLSADVVKQAIFASADSINAQFEKMPMTWNQVWTTMQNTAIMQLQPVLDKINELANNEQFQAMLIGLMDGFTSIVMILLTIMEVAGTVAQFFSDNWSIISPIIYGIITALGLYLAVLAIVNTINMISAGIAAVKAAADMMQAGATFAATVAQYGLNAALLACPLTWIIALIILLIVIIFMVANAIAKMTGVANTGFGVITGGINVVIAFFKNLGLTVANIALGIGNAIAALASNMMTAFNNAICSIKSWFYSLLSTAISVVEGICAALNKLPFVKFDYSGISAKANEYAAKAAQAAGAKQEYKSISAEFSKGFKTFDTFQSGWASNAFKSGASWGDGVMGKLSNMLNFDGKIPKVDTGSMFNGAGYTPGDYSGGGGYDGSNVPKNIADTAGNTARAADTLQITDENLKYLRDIAERDVINRFTTAEITVEMNNTNNINSDMDLDGVVDYLANGVQEAMEQAAEGVHD